MSDPLGDVLTNTLNRAADAAPSPPADLYRRLTRRHARRRGGLVATVAAVSVFVLLTVVIGLLRTTDQPPVPVADDGKYTLPATLDGREYLVDAVLPDGRILAHTRVPDWQRIPAASAATDVKQELGVFSRDGRDWTPLVAVGRGYFVDVTAYDTWLVWRLSQAGSADGIYSRRWGQDTTRKIVAAPGGLGTFSITLVGDTVVYGPSETGVRTIPADGGTPTLLPDTGGKYYQVQWPWLVLQGNAPHPPKSAHTEFRNLETGERRTAVPAATTWRDACSTVWCVSVSVDGDTVTTARIDGTGKRTWPDHRTDHVGLTPVLDRYLPLYEKTPAADGSLLLDLVDVSTGKAVGLGRLKGTPDTGPGFVDWTDAGRKRHVLDLRRIG